jgi:cytochrome P450
MPFLDAIINESMRLWPAVFIVGQRITPPSGLSINEIYIPGNTVVSIPPYAVNRDARNFERPDEFVPERWTTQPELIKNKAVFIPFSTGLYSCAGKNMAMMELRSVAGRVLNEFDVVLPEDFDARAYFAGIRNRFTSGPPPKQLLKFVRVGE